MSTSVLDIIKRSLRLLGVSATNEAPDSPETKDAFNVLNAMLDQWNTEKLSIYAMKNTLFTASIGTAAYTIGPGGTWNTTTNMRPVKIESIFVRDNSSGYNIDIALELIPNDRYQQIYQKQITSTYPRYAWYLPDYPLGTITLWPVPTTALYVNISQWELLPRFTTTADTVTLPPGYEMALGYALAYEMALEYGVDPMKYYKQMMDAKANIQRVNSETVLMTTDSFLAPKLIYNIYNDRF